MASLAVGSTCAFIEETPGSPMYWYHPNVTLSAKGNLVSVGKPTDSIALEKPGHTPLTPSTLKFIETLKEEVLSLSGSTVFLTNTGI